MSSRQTLICGSFDTAQWIARAQHDMDDVQRCHDVLLQQRTQIRHHQSLHLWMKRCWQVAAHAELHTMTQDEYEDFYSILMYEMTICWEEELNDAILCKLWQRDAASYTTLNFDRFCCSLFYFVEMWVEEITLAEYEKIFNHVYRILAGHEATAMARSPSPDYKPRTFKPTLESFNNAIDNERAMEELQMNFGKSISFNAQQYYRHFGTPTTHLQAFQATLLHLQSRVLIEPTTERGSRPSADHARPTSSSSASTCRMLRRQLKEARRKTPRSDVRPSSPLHSETMRNQGSTSPPRLLRPVSSSYRRSFVLALDSDTPPGSATSPERSRHGGEAFMMTGKSVLSSPHANAR